MGFTISSNHKLANADTAGRDALSSASHLTGKNVKPFAHFDTISWHAGSYGGRQSFNKYSIGIEVDNTGIFTKVDVDKLNICQGSGSNYEKVSQTLRNSQDVPILHEENDWYKVRNESNRMGKQRIY